MSQSWKFVSTGCFTGLAGVLLSRSRATVTSTLQRRALSLGKDVRGDLADVKAARLMVPDDTNPAGNVHGGSILRFMTDNGGAICAKRYVNGAQVGPKEPLDVALVGIAHMDFWGPMFVGDLAEVTAEVTYSSRSSIQVAVKVFADNLSGKRRLTNEATLWYVAVQHVSNSSNLVLSKNLPIYSFDEGATQKYEEQKEMRKERKLENLSPASLNERDWSIQLSQLVLPSDCYSSSFIQGGVVLKLMDNAAGIAAARHCRTNVVTASIESLDFVNPIFNGNLITIRARPTFASTKSLEILVVVEAEDLHTGRSYIAVQGYLVFVSLDPCGKPLPIKSLPDPKNDSERAERKKAEDRYLDRRKKLQASRK